MLVTLIGLNGEQPPTDEAGFLAYARSLPVPGFTTRLPAEPLTEPYGYWRAAHRLRHTRSRRATWRAYWRWATRLRTEPGLRAGMTVAKR